MIKRFVVLRRKRGMSATEFQTYWRDTHGPLIAKIPGLRRYVQYHVRSEIAEGEDEPIDGIAELWFDDEASQQRAYATEEYAAVVKDEPNLFDMNSRSIHPVMEIQTVLIVE